MTAIADRNDMLRARSHAVRDVIRESFTENLTDGYFYPDGQGEPLVRIYVATGSYCIERRRNASNPWMPIVTADIAEFDASAFRSWRQNWRLLAV